MAEVILTADRVTLNEAKKVSKDLIGEIAPEFLLMDDEGNEFDSRSLNGEWEFSSSTLKTAPQRASVVA